MINTGSFIFPEAQSPPRHLHFLTMEKWDLLVPSGKTAVVEIKKGQFLRLTYITLGDGESKDPESVKLFLKKEAWKEKLIMCTLDKKRNPQYMFDLFFNKKFEVSHDRKQGYVHYFGYTEEDQFKVEDSDISKTLGSFIFPEAQSPRHLHFLTMEEWDLLVPCGKTSLVEIKKGSLLRLTYITLVDGESMEHESVKLFLKKEAWKEKRMMGTLDTKRIPQHTFDLFFNKNFEVSHHRTQDSVHYFGFIKDSQGASTSHDASAAGRKPKKPNKNTTFKFA